MHLQHFEDQNGLSLWREKVGVGRAISFYSFKQREGQSLTVYLAELQKLATTCDWKEEQLAENLRDKFVMGLHNERLLQQLLT